MKCKVSTGSGMRGLLSYIEKDDAQHIAGTQQDSVSFLREVAALRSLRPDCKKAVAHFSLSLPQSETLSEEKWVQAIESFKQKMNLEDHAFFAVRHNDTDHDHIHIAACMIDATGKRWDSQKSAIRAQRACTEIEQELNLTQTRSLSDFRRETGHRHNIVRDSATNEFRRTGKVKSRVQLAIQARKSKEKANEQDRTAHHQRAEQLTDARTDATRDRQSASEARSENKRARGAIRSFTNRKDEVIFKQDNQIIARMNDKRTAIECFEIDENAIRFAIDHAVKNGQVPLKIFGSSEFVAAATKIAQEKNIEIFNHKKESKPMPMHTPAPAHQTSIDRLKIEIDKIEDAINKKYSLESERDWRYPLAIASWIQRESKTNRERTAEEFADLARADERINLMHTSEALENLKESAKDEDEEDTNQHLKMKA